MPAGVVLPEPLFFFSVPLWQIDFDFSREGVIFCHFLVRGDI
jgi:hypothetical protein